MRRTTCQERPGVRHSVHHSRDQRQDRGPSGDALPLGSSGRPRTAWLLPCPPAPSLYSSNNGLKFDKHYDVIKPILKKLNPKKVFDIRANLLVPTPHHIYHEFHTDRSVPHKVALFYVTTCNGFTILKNQPKINCLENRMLLFDGFIEHHSVTSTDFPRCVFNINYL